VDVGVEAVDAHVRHPRANPAKEGDGLVLAEVELMLRVQHLEEPPECRALRVAQIDVAVGLRAVHAQATRPAAATATARVMAAAMAPSGSTESTKPVAMAARGMLANSASLGSC